MSISLQTQLEARLREYQDPFLQQDFLLAKQLKEITIEQNRISIVIACGYPISDIAAQLTAQLAEWLHPITKGYDLQLHLTNKIEPHAGHQQVPGLPQIKNIIAVGSGKGGVGKSTVAINLALALAHAGAQVGLLDADIYGPSQPTMLGQQDAKPVVKDKTLQPIHSHGLQTMSIGYLIDSHAPMVWRGPMLGKALEQLIHDTQWQALDYLVIDLPPGTGDVQLTLCQKIPVSGAVVVTTPQDLALLDVQRACEMFRKLNVPVLGVMENMSYYQCPQCKHQTNIFGHGGGEKLAQAYEVPLLGCVPLDIHVREMTDSGQPPLVQDPESEVSRIFRQAARRLAATLALQRKDYSGKFPKVVVKQK